MAKSPDDREEQGRKKMEETNLGNTKMGEEGIGENGPCAGLPCSPKRGEEGVSQQHVEAPTQRQGKSEREKEL